MLVDGLCYILPKGFIVRDKLASLGTPAIHPTFEVHTLKASGSAYDYNYDYALSMQTSVL